MVRIFQRAGLLQHHLTCETIDRENIYGYKLVFQSRLTRQKEVYYHHFSTQSTPHIHILYEGEE